ncbi:hypothetical protein V1506DRAFT_550351 [Lipomyces tetrasporus]
MDAVEGRAMQEPLCAKTLALDTIAREFCLDKEAWKALGIPLPTVNNQDWYERRGYKIYKRVEHNYPQKDLAGKIWHIPAVFMKKSVV